MSSDDDASSVEGEAPTKKQKVDKPGEEADQVKPRVKQTARRTKKPAQDDGENGSDVEDEPKPKVKQTTRRTKKPTEDEEENGASDVENYENVKAKPKVKLTARRTKKAADEDAGNGASDMEDEENIKPKAKQTVRKQKNSDDESGSNGMYSLTHMRFMSVSEFKGKPLVNIREYYEKDGKTLPGSKGISLSIEQWDFVKKYTPNIERDLKKFR